MQRSLVVLAALVVLALLPGTASAHHPPFTAGAPGIGDPYFPLDGNGGYDVSHYDLAIRYDPSTDRLQRPRDDPREGDAEPLALQPRPARAHRARDRRQRATGRLQPRRRRADRHAARRPAQGQALHRACRLRRRAGDAPDDGSGFVHTDDGALVVGQPDVAATWYPVNDHPLDKASYSFDITVPARAARRWPTASCATRQTRRGWTTWAWEAHGADGVLPGDRHQRRLRAARPTSATGSASSTRSTPTSTTSRDPRTGSRYALSQKANDAYKRLGRTIAVPASGGTADVLGRARHREATGTSSSSRRTRPAPTTGRRCPT